MKFILSLAVVVLAFAHHSIAAALIPRQAESFKLYAYGHNMADGLRVFIADGMVYAGNEPPANASTVADITLSTADRESGVWNVTADNGEFDPAIWGITNSGGTLEGVGMAGSNSTMNTTGFGLYGAYAYRFTDTGDIQMNYRAIPTGVDDLYVIKWASTGMMDDDCLLVNLRTTAPMPSTDKNKNRRDA